MPPAPLPVFSGSLQPKKKAELQQIATALKLSDTGTNYELQQRIKKHLENNPELEDKEAFKGLYGRKGSRTTRGSVQPVETTKAKGRFAPDVDEDEEEPSPTTSPSRRTLKHVTPLDPIIETQTPQRDMRNISFMLKNPLSPINDPEPQEGSLSETWDRNNTLEDDLHCVPQCEKYVITASPSPARELSPFQPRPRSRLQVIAARAQLGVASMRAFLSNASNISRLVTEVEFIYILLSLITYGDIFLTPSPEPGLRLPTFTSLVQSGIYLPLVHWAIPSVIVPWIVGIFVSFRYPTDANLPATSPGLRSVLTPFTFDIVSAAVARFACHVAYPYDKLPDTPFSFPRRLVNPLPPTPPTPISMDVLGTRWRLVDAGVVLACALAEALFESQRQQRQEAGWSSHLGHL